VGGIHQGGVVGLGEAAPFTLAAAMSQGSIDQPAALNGLDTDQPSDGDPPGTLARHRNLGCGRVGCTSWLWAVAGFGRPRPRRRSTHRAARQRSSRRPRVNTHSWRSRPRNPQDHRWSQAQRDKKTLSLTPCSARAECPGHAGSAGRSSVDRRSGTGGGNAIVVGGLRLRILKVDCL
jgi:hypothetical protein